MYNHWKINKVFQFMCAQSEPPPDVEGLPAQDGVFRAGLAMARLAHQEQVHFRFRRGSGRGAGSAVGAAAGPSTS